MHEIEQIKQGPSAGFSGQDVPSFEVLNTCVKCGLCLPTCPTYRETMREQSSPRGRIHLMQGVWEGRLDVLDPVFVEQAYECLDCRACEAVCPSGVRYGEVIEDSRAQIERARRDPSASKSEGDSASQGCLFRDLCASAAPAPARIAAPGISAQRAPPAGALIRLIEGSPAGAARIARPGNQQPFFCAARPAFCSTRPVAGSSRALSGVRDAHGLSRRR